MALRRRAPRVPHIATGPLRTWRAWFPKRPRRYDDVAPALVCGVCGASTPHTPELDARLGVQPVPCQHCGEGTFRREW